MTVPSWLQFVAKGGVLAVAVVLTVLHDLSSPIAMVLAAALGALGVTNAAQLIASAGQVANAVAPPKPPPPPVPPTAIATAVAGMMGIPVLAEPLRRRDPWRNERRGPRPSASATPSSSKSTRSYITT